MDKQNPAGQLEGGPGVDKQNTTNQLVARGAWAGISKILTASYPVARAARAWNPHGQLDGNPGVDKQKILPVSWSPG